MSAVNKVGGLIVALIMVSVVLLLGIYIADSVIATNPMPNLAQSYTATNTTQINTGASASSITHLLNLGLPSTDTKYYAGAGSLQVTFNYTTPSGGLDVYVNTHLLGHISDTATSPITFTNVSTSWIVASSPVNVTYHGYNASVTKSVLTLDTDANQYKMSQANQQTISNIASAFNITTVVPIIMVASVIIGILYVLMKLE